MKALVFHRPGHVSVDTVEDPRIIHDTDAIVRVTATAICGSDLHIYNGLLPQERPLVLGHEFVGIVEDVGRAVTKLRKGDRVVVPFPIACGHCFFCTADLPGHCETSNPRHYGPEGTPPDQKGGGMFGYSDLYGGYAGGQAELVRVPFADTGPRRIPEALSDEQALFLSDILPTGYAAIDRGGVKGGETVAVFGCGPVGLMAQKMAWLRGAARVIGIDREEYRLTMARETTAAETIAARDQDAVEVLRAMTEGRGPDVVVDAVGMEAHRSLADKASEALHREAGTTSVLRDAVRAVRRGGVVSVVGVYGSDYDDFPLGQIFDKGLSLRFGQAPVHRYIDELMHQLEGGHIRTTDIITHRLPLREAAHGYDIFCRKQDGCVKVVMTP